MNGTEVVVVTGASAGIGRATVRAFARRGASIGLLARGRDGLEAAREEVESLGGTALVIPTDVADPDQMEAAAAAVEEMFGPIDIWVNNAMVSVFSPAKEMTAADYKRVTDVTYLGYVYGTLAALKRMLPRDHGTIVQVGSALAYRGIPLQSAYCGAKHAIEGFTESLRSELLHDGSKVKITMVQLALLNGFVRLEYLSHLRNACWPNSFLAFSMARTKSVSSCFSWPSESFPASICRAISVTKESRVSKLPYASRFHRNATNLRTTSRSTIRGWSFSFSPVANWNSLCETSR